MARRTEYAWRQLILLALLSCCLQAQIPVGYQRLLNATEELRNSTADVRGRLFHNRYSRLTQITPGNAKNLSLAWVYQSPAAGSWQAMPLVVDGVMYLTQRPNEVVALDATTGRVFWIYRYSNAADVAVCCGANNRGLAILNGTLFMGTLDAHLVAIDARSGHSIWITEVANGKSGYSVTLAPLAVKDKVIVGVGTSGGEWGIRGFIAAYEATTGKEAWEVLHNPGTWGTRPRNLGVVSPRNCRVLRPGGVEARRRLCLGYGVVRSGPQSELLGDRQRRSGL